MNMIAILSTNPFLIEDENISLLVVSFLSEGTDRTVHPLLSKFGAVSMSVGSLLDEDVTISWSVDSLSGEDGIFS